MTYTNLFMYWEMAPTRPAITKSGIKYIVSMAIVLYLSGRNLHFRLIPQTAPIQGKSPGAANSGAHRFDLSWLLLREYGNG